MTPDRINAFFEFGGGALLLMNVWRLYRDKSLRGVCITPTAFFTLWGYWNLYYYHALGQWWSWVAGMVVAAVNTAWVVLALRYRLRARFQRRRALRKLGRVVHRGLSERDVQG
ncbi:MAG TPA: hypothetical protein VNA25_04880 [Phycisphaerae bacterium]|nr:hypothetical protein [Phycisphaerae bacterium]